MIQLTFTFPSVAAARKALLELPEDLFAHVGEIAPAPKPEKPKASKTVAAPEAAPVPVTVEPEVAPVAAPAAIDYPVLQKAVFALAGKSREAASEVAQSFGVKTFKDLDKSKWADALAAVNAKVAELG